MATKNTAGKTAMKNELFTIENVRALKADIANALQGVEKKYGVAIEYNSPNTFSQYATKLALEITKPMPFENEYRRVADKYGLKTDWIGKSFWTPGGRNGLGSTYRILGFDSVKEVVVTARLDKQGKIGIGNLYDVKPTVVIERMAKEAA